MRKRLKKLKVFLINQLTFNKFYFTIYFDRSVNIVYNSTQKLRYIDYLISKGTKSEERTRQRMVNLFEKMSDVEERLGKDFSQFDLSEIKSALPEICIRSVGYQRVVIGYLRSYLEWCIEEGLSLDQENRLVGIDIRGLNIGSSYNETMIKDNLQLDEYLNIVMRPLQEDSVDNMYRVYYHLLFDGLTLDEALNLKQEQVDLDHKLIHLNHKDIFLSDLTCKYIRYLSKMRVYCSATKAGGIKSYKIIENGYVLKRTTPDRSRFKIVAINFSSKYFSNLKEALQSDLTLNITSIMLSGIFYRMYQEELKGNQVLYDEYLSRYNREDMTTALNEGKMGYKAWKETFYPTNP